LYEKRRRRRESHNAVERRRRDNINERIAEMGTLLPEIYLGTDPNVKPHKGQILRKAVDYVRVMQATLRDSLSRQTDLENSLRQMGIEPAESSLGNSIQALLNVPLASTMKMLTMDMGMNESFPVRSMSMGTSGQYLYGQDGIGHADVNRISPELGAQGLYPSGKSFQSIPTFPDWMNTNATYSPMDTKSAHSSMDVKIPSSLPTGFPIPFLPPQQSRP
jgi:hypothetical protein